MVEASPKSRPAFVEELHLQPWDPLLNLPLTHPSQSKSKIRASLVLFTIQAFSLWRSCILDIRRFLEKSISGYIESGNLGSPCPKYEFRCSHLINGCSQGSPSMNLNPYRFRFGLLGFELYRSRLQTVPMSDLLFHKACLFSCLGVGMRGVLFMLAGCY